MKGRKDRRFLANLPQGAAAATRCPLGSDLRNSLTSGNEPPEPVELTIEVLEERLTPGYPARAARKTANWGC